MFGLFNTAAKPDHPLAEPKELKRVVAELQGMEPAAAVAEGQAWFQSLNAAPDFSADLRLRVVAQLDEAVLPNARRLASNYVAGAQLTRAQELKLWQTACDYWKEAAAAYARCLDGLAGKALEALKPSLPLLHARRLHALGAQLKWMQLRYGLFVGDSFWSDAGRAYLDAGDAGVAHQAVAVFPGVDTTPEGEYVKLLVFQASSMSSLMPHEMEIGERLIQRFLPSFELSAQSRAGATYWIDAARPLPPTRLARPPEAAATLRFLGFGQAAQAAAQLGGELAAGKPLPPDLNLGGEYAASSVQVVLRHLERAWSPQAAMRKHPRHRVKSRLGVVSGLAAVHARLMGRGDGEGETAEAWVTEDVSQGGMAAHVQLTTRDWLRIGSLLGMQPEGGDNWLVGVVRRFVRGSEFHGTVGIETLSKTPRALIVGSVGRQVDAILLDPVAPGTIVRLLVPDTAWDSHEPLYSTVDGAHTRFAPAGALEGVEGYVLGRYTIGAA